MINIRTKQTLLVDWHSLVLSDLQAREALVELHSLWYAPHSRTSASRRWTKQRALHRDLCKNDPEWIKAGIGQT